MKEYYSLTEAAEILGYSSGAVLRVYIHMGIIKGKKFGRNWVVSGREVKKRQEHLKEYYAKKQAKKER